MLTTEAVRHGDDSGQRISAASGGDVPDDLDIVTLAQLFWRGRMTILLTTLALFLGAVLYLNLAKYSYTVEYQVTPTDGGQGSLLGMLGGFGALAGVSLGAEEPASPFALYLGGLKGRPVAEDVARDEQLLRGMFPEHWDEAEGRWRKPEGGVGPLAEAVKGVLGLPVRPWQKPDAAEVQLWLERELDVMEMSKTSLALVSLDHADRAFAADLLRKIHESSDGRMRARTLERTTAYVRYLERELPSVTIAEQRQALAQLLSDQEKQRMMATADVAFAAEIFAPVASSPKPTFPKPGLVLAGALLGGAFLGCLILFSGELLRRRRISLSAAG